MREEELGGCHGHNLSICCSCTQSVNSFILKVFFYPDVTTLTFDTNIFGLKLRSSFQLQALVIFWFFWLVNCSKRLFNRGVVEAFWVQFWQWKQKILPALCRDKINTQNIEEIGDSCFPFQSTLCLFWPT